MTLTGVETLLDGATAMASLVIALLFVRLGRTARDRLYQAFALAFALHAVSSVLIGLGVTVGDRSELVFVPRLIAFVAIIAAIVDKNRRGKR